MRKTDSRLVVLLASALRRNGAIVLPLPTAPRLARRLLAEGLVTEIRSRGAQAGWRKDKDGQSWSLRITKRGRSILNFKEDPELSISAMLAKHLDQKNTASSTPTTPPLARPGSKKEKILKLLRDGATIGAIIDATGWQAHSVRGFLAGTIRKKLNLPLSSSQQGRERIYRICEIKPRQKTNPKSSPNRKLSK